ncbi:MAG: PstS family phosphate ABC transporter substrate-binding protein [Oscillospiraceae bacterium]
MKRYLVLLLALAMLLVWLGGCQKAEQEEPEKTQELAQEGPEQGTEDDKQDGGASGAFVFTRENMPRLDGSTSTAPLALAVCAKLLGETEDEAADLVQFNKTTTAYYNLIDGSADMLIVGEANGDVLAYKEERGFEWEKEPFATDAFVFVVNEANPVSSITVEQARKIYSGEITNWKELGGEDCEITALQRNSGAGSQTLMEKLVMQGTPMMEAPTEYVIDTMGGLIEAVKSYDGSPNAIGYTVYYYAEEMKMAQGLKLLAVEGVEPNPDTIRSEEYPLVNPKYVVIPADAEETSPNRMLFNWLLSDEGQALIAEVGYVSVVDPDTLGLVGTRLSGDYMGGLVPSEDYGMLVPYAGRRLMDDWPAISGCVYGLMTLDGCAVTDAVYSEAYYAGYYDGSWSRLPLLILKSSETGKIAVAASDGSWCTDFEYECLSAAAEGLALYAGDTVTVMAVDGTATKKLSYTQIGLSEDEWRGMLSSLESYEGYGGQYKGGYIGIDWLYDGKHDTVRCYDLAGGKIEEMSSSQWAAVGVTREYTEPECAVKAEGYMDCIMDAAFGFDAPALFCDRNFDGQTVTYYTADGTQLTFLPTDMDWHDRWYNQVSLLGGLVEVLELNRASYYSLENFECVFRTYLGYEE